MQTADHLRRSDYSSGRRPILYRLVLDPRAPGLMKSFRTKIIREGMQSMFSTGLGDGNCTTPTSGQIGVSSRRSVGLASKNHRPKVFCFWILAHLTVVSRNETETGIQTLSRPISTAPQSCFPSASFGDILNGGEWNCKAR